MSAVEIRYATVGAVIQLVPENCARVSYRTEIHDTDDARAAAGA